MGKENLDVIIESIELDEAGWMDKNLFVSLRFGGKKFFTQTESAS